MLAIPPRVDDRGSIGEALFAWPAGRADRDVAQRVVCAMI
jgi:hypothetical protein